MKQVNISQAKTHLSRYVAYVREGGRVRIFDRDVPVADLIPIEPGPSSSEGDAALLADMERRGIVRRGKGGELPPEILRPGPRGATVLDALLEERRGGR